MTRRYSLRHGPLVKNIAEQTATWGSEFGQPACSLAVRNKANDGDDGERNAEPCSRLFGWILC